MDNARKTVDNLKNISQSEAFTVNDRFIFQEGEKVSKCFFADFFVSTPAIMKEPLGTKLQFFVF